MSYMAYRSLKYTYVIKKILELSQWWSSSETLLFSLQIWRFAICGLGHKGNLWLCELIITNLWICYFRTGTPKKFADLWLRNEPKNLRICDLRTKKTNLHAHLWKIIKSKNLAYYIEKCLSRFPCFGLNIILMASPLGGRTGDQLRWRIDADD